MPTTSLIFFQIPDFLPDGFIHFVLTILVVNSCNVHVVYFCILDNKFNLFWTTTLLTARMRVRCLQGILRMPTMSLISFQISDFLPNGFIHFVLTLLVVNSCDVNIVYFCIFGNKFDLF